MVFIYLFKLEWHKKYNNYIENFRNESYTYIKLDVVTKNKIDKQQEDSEVESEEDSEVESEEESEVESE